MQFEYFRLPTWPWAGLFGALQLPFIAALWFSYGFVATIPSLIVATLSLAFVFWAGQLSVGQDGISLYRVNRMRWTDVKRARRKIFLGLEYVHVERWRGMSWWIPLYLVGARDVCSALIERAPAGNPIRECLANKPDRQRSAG